MRRSPSPNGPLGINPTGRAEAQALIRVRRSRPFVRPLSITGTPGTGKSSVARALPARYPWIEVGELALRFGAGRGSGREIEVDLPALARAMRSSRPGAFPPVLVGHLAHLLPIRDVVVLRCHPVELALRLGRARRGTAVERHENLVVEATDVILGEALARRRRVWEIDTTGRTVSDIALEVRAIIARRRAPRHGRTDWLSDPAVTAHLLPPAR